MDVRVYGFCSGINVNSWFHISYFQCYTLRDGTGPNTSRENYEIVSYVQCWWCKPVYRPFLSGYMHVVYYKCMQRSCIYLIIFSRTCVHILAIHYDAMTPLMFSSIFIKNVHGCLQYNSYSTNSYIFWCSFCLLILFIWLHIYHEINNCILFKQYFLFDRKSYSSTKVWKHRAEHITPCALLGRRLLYIFLLWEKII